MSLEQVGVQLGIGLVVAAVCAGVGWWFRKPLKEAISSLDASLNQVLAWIIIFIMIALNIVYAFLSLEVPASLAMLSWVLLGAMITMVISSTPRSKN